MAHSRHRVPHAESEKLPRADNQEGCPDPSQSGALTPEDSDFFPSVSLAAALLLIFISVLPLLSQPGMVFVPFRKEAHFHPLLYIQPRSTQLTIETLAKSHAETIMVLAVAKEHATQTLMCFSKNVMALLSEHGQGHPVVRQRVEVMPLKDRRNSSGTRASGVLSVSVITKRRDHTPHCTILRPPSLLEISLHQEREVTVWRESSTIAHDLLELVHKTGHVPETFEVKASPRHHVKVLHVLGDPYLESGIVC